MLDFKKRSLNELLNLFFNADSTEIPFNFESSTNSVYKIYTNDDYTVSVLNNLKTKEIDIRHNETQSVLGYCSSTDYESFNSNSISYYKDKNKNEITYKEFSLKNINFLFSEHHSEQRISVSDELAIFRKVHRYLNSITNFYLETKFPEDLHPNITLHERYQWCKTRSSTAYFRARAYNDPEKVYMYTVDIDKHGDSYLCKIEAGYNKKIQFEMQSKDASLVNLYNPLYTFQAELGMESDEAKIFNLVKSTIISKLQYYKSLGGRISMIDRVLKNIEANSKV